MEEKADSKGGDIHTCDGLLTFIKEKYGEFQQSKYCSLKDLLLAALQYNLENVKHVETQRLTLFNIHVIITAAIISTFTFFGINSIIFVILLWFFFFSSIMVYFCDLKYNASVSEAYTVIQWISEKLGLIKKMKEEEERRISTELRKLGVKKIPRHIFSKKHISISQHHYL